MVNRTKSLSKGYENRSTDRVESPVASLNCHIALGLLPLVLQFHEKKEPLTCLSPWFRVFCYSLPNTILTDTQVMHFRTPNLCPFDSPCLKGPSPSCLLVLQLLFSIHLQSLRLPRAPLFLPAPSLALFCLPT